MRSNYLTSLALCFLLFTGGTVSASLLTNGDFESGSLVGWTQADQAGGSGSFFVTSVASSPLSGFPTAGPAGGSFYAVTDQTGPGAHVLYQGFTVAPGQAVTLSFDMFANDQSGLGPIVNPVGLDYSDGPNQHSRVDILSGVGDPFDTGAAVLANYYLGIDAGPNPHPYTHYSFDISSVVSAGGTFYIRFGEVDNQLFFQQGIDNVDIAAVPEPGTIALLGAGLVGLAFLRRRTA